MSNGNEKPSFQMPPPPKPLLFEMPKPPVLNPNVNSILQKTTTVPQPTVIPNPFAPRPSSVSPVPKKNPEVQKKVEVCEKSEEKKKEDKEIGMEKVEPEKVKTTETEEQIEVEDEKPKAAEPPQTLHNLNTTNTITTEIPITPMVEEHREMSSPATVEVSDHCESTKSPVESSVFTDKVNMSGGLMSWFTKTVTESKLLSDVAEKAKAGMETVITTLDPGMKPFLAEHEVIEFALFNCDAETLSVASDAFTKAGAMAISRGLRFDETSELVMFRPLVHGDQKARKLCDAKIEAAKKSKKTAEDSAIVVVQPFLLEISGRHYATSKIALHHQNITFDAISQLLEVHETVVEAIQRAAKSEGLPEDEYSITVSQAIKNFYKSSVSSWEPGSLPPYDSQELLSTAFSSVTQQLLRNLAPVN